MSTKTKEDIKEDILRRLKVAGIAAPVRERNEDRMSPYLTDAEVDALPIGALLRAYGHQYG